ncbi:MAG: heavy metal transporter [Candidatus Marinimicrobia bacterium]|nr:heavy metal transporter [Candidatus Neomarinimicrobiota bacterium]
MHCEACVSKIEKALHSIKGIEKATVNLNDETAIIQGDSKLDEVISVIFDLGYTATLNDNSAIKESTAKKLIPLYLSFLYIIAGSLIINRSELILENFMYDFMGLFFIVFSFFKFLDYKNFPSTFKMYDPIAKVIPLYGWIYPFIESMLGLAFLMREQLYIALIISLIILVTTTAGVVRTLIRKESIQCACLGTALKLPMTTATIIENSIMLFMTIWMLIKF